MSPDDMTGPPAPDRREPIGAPVVRGDPEITGAHAEDATEFDPDDPESLIEAMEIIRVFSESPDIRDVFTMLQGAAAAAALVRGKGSYKAAAEQTGVSVNFLRKWARVHDLPISVRRSIARGEITPSAAKHIARLNGNARFLVAWAVIDNDLSVQEVRQLASVINEGVSVERAFADHEIDLGSMNVSLPPATYRKLRRYASLEDRSAESIMIEAVNEWISGQP